VLAHDEVPGPVVALAMLKDKYAEQEFVERFQASEASVAALSLIPT